MCSVGTPLPPGVVRGLILLKQKGAAYGDSWRKRGEMFSILPNVARKIDRIGVPGAGDTLQDTVMDLLCYCLLYACWLNGETEANEKQLQNMAVDIWESSGDEIIDARREGFVNTPSAIDGYVTNAFEQILRAYELTTQEWRYKRIRRIAAILMHDARLEAE